MFCNVECSNSWLKLKYSFKLRYSITFLIPVSFFSHSKAIENVSKSYSLKNSAENVTETNFHVELMLKHIIMIVYPIV